MDMANKGQDQEKRQPGDSDEYSDSNEYFAADVSGSLLLE